MNNRLAATMASWGLVCVLLLEGCGDHASQPSTQPPTESVQTPTTQASRVVHVPPAAADRLHTEIVALRPIQETVSAPGEVAVDLKRVAKVTSRIEGQVVQVYVKLGDRVSTRQPLVAIESLRLDELVQEYLVSKAQADVAENTFRRTEKLRSEDIVPERRFIEDRGRHLESKARYQHVREKLLHMGLTTTDLRELEQGSHMEGHQATLKAPLSGTVVTQNVVLGQGVSPGDDLLEVMDTSRVWIFANLPIEVARQFKEGDTGTIVPKGGEAVTAPLTYLAPLADEKTRTVVVRFEALNPMGHLKPHEYVEVRLTLNSAPTLAVPSSALTLVEQTRGVFVQLETGYTFVPVEIGREGGGWIEITKGLTPGDHVVTDGVFDLKNVLMKEAIRPTTGG